MTSFLNNIKSSLILKLIANNIPYIRFLKIVKHTKSILKKIDITEEYFRVVSAVKRVIAPSYEIEKYFDYFKINKNENVLSKKNSKKKIDVNEWTLYKCLNSSNFNIKLKITDKNFETIINNAYKINLIIEPDSIDYLNNSSYEEKEKIYNLLNRNKIHILELSICRFKFDQSNIKNILGLLKIIFIGNKNNNNQNKEHFVKKFNFLDNNLENEQAVIWNEINNIISLKNISLNIDYNGLSQQQINEIEEFIEKNSSTLKSLELRINDSSLVADAKSSSDVFAGYPHSLEFFYSSLYRKKSTDRTKPIDKSPQLSSPEKIFNKGLEERSMKLKRLFGLSSNNIQILNLSNYTLNYTILNIMNSKFKMLQLKELKLKINFDSHYSLNSSNWNFILQIVNTLEVFELNIQIFDSFQLKQSKTFEDFYYYYLDSISDLEAKKFPSKVWYNIGNFGNLISSLNQIKKLKHLKLNFIITGEKLMEFKNFDNIEYLYVVLETLPICLKDYFAKFKKLKSLVVYNKCKNSTAEKNFRLIIPSSLDSLKLRNFDLDVINSILNCSKNNLTSIKKLLIDYKAETIKDFRQLILYYLLYFKSLKKLSIYGISKQDCSPIFKVVPSLIEFNFRFLSSYYYSYNSNNDSFDDLKSSMKRNIIYFSYQAY